MVDILIVLSDRLCWVICCRPLTLHWDLGSEGYCTCQ